MAATYLVNVELNVSPAGGAGHAAKIFEHRVKHPEGTIKDPSCVSVRNTSIRPVPRQDAVVLKAELKVWTVTHAAAIGLIEQRIERSEWTVKLGANVQMEIATISADLEKVK